MDTVTIQNYRNRFQRVLHHIDAHLDDDLSVETLSGVAAFSRFHFHRQFSELLGIGVFPYIQGLRLKQVLSAGFPQGNVDSGDCTVQSL